MKPYAQAEMKRAHASLLSAAQLARTDPNSSASRAYYAMFHALLAVFATRDQQFRKHREVRAALHRDLVNEGHVPEELGQDYNEVMDLRELGDYGGMSGVNQDDAERAVAKARRFVEAMERLCEAA